MKKSLLALAVAGAFVAPGIASATNVSMWGWLNPSVASSSASSSESTGNSIVAAGVAGTATPSHISTHPNVSLIGISGEEDLGNGLKATMRAETGFGIDGTDYGASTPGLYTRESKVGLAGSWGEVFIGNWHSPLKALGYGHRNNFGSVLLDVFGEANNATEKALLSMPGAFANSFSGTVDGSGGATSFSQTPSFDSRLGRALAFWSPVINDNLSFQVHFSPNGARSNAATFNDPSVLAANVIFDNGTLGVGAAWEQRKDLAGLNTLTGSTDGTSSTDRAYRLALGFKLGATAVNFKFENISYKVDGVTSSELNEYDRDAWSFGVSHSWDAHSVRGRYSKASAGGCTIGDGSACSTADAGAQETAFGYTYTLSKRTQLVVNWIKVDNEANAQYGFGGYGNDSGMAGTDGPGQTAKSLTFGVQHGF